MTVKITERGWCGHFIAGQSCRFRRNTLIENGDKRIIVSTIGAYYPDHRTSEMEAIGHERWYETMVFEAKKDGPYWDADVEKQLSVDGEWGIWGKTTKDLPSDVDNKANEMHERIVNQFSDDLTAVAP